MMLLIQVPIMIRATELRQMLSETDDDSVKAGLTKLLEYIQGHNYEKPITDDCIPVGVSVWPELFWGKSHVALFTKDKEDQYRLLKKYDWYCYLIDENINPALVFKHVRTGEINMAHMIPPIPKSFDPKSEEGIVFSALRKLPDDYYVFHSVSFSVVDSGTLYEREVDFVVANQKKGILCIEAKNGSGIRYDGRCWRYSSGLPMEHDGPYHQVATAKRGIISKIRCHANPEVQALYDKCKVMHAVFFLNCQKWTLTKWCIRDFRKKQIQELH